jgi:hypothetical protein
MSKKITYGVRDFASLRSELVNLTQQYYPDLVQNFNDASVYSVLLDLKRLLEYLSNFPTYEG